MNNKKIKIFMLGKDGMGWAIDEIRKTTIECLKANNCLITKNIFNAKYIYCVWYSVLSKFPYHWLKFLKKILNQKIIAVPTNDVIYYKDRVDKIKDFVDIWVAPSKRAYDFLSDQGFKVYRIPFIVNTKEFQRLNLSKKEICEKLGVDCKKIENKIVIGSFQRDSLGSDLSKPKWHKDPDLLIEIMEKLPKDKFVLLLAGPRRHYIINKCLEKNINFLFCGDYSYIENNRDGIKVNGLSLEKVNYLYNLTDIYMITSKSEGGPKQVIESALTKTLVFSTNVGLSSDFLHEDLIFNSGNTDALINKINDFVDNPEAFKKYIDYNYDNAAHEMDKSVLNEKYKRVILDNI